jgi:hypothetical protein
VGAACPTRRGWRLAHLYVFCKMGDSCCRRRNFQLGFAPLIDSHCALFPESIAPIACKKAVPSNLVVPTFTKSVKVGQPPELVACAHVCVSGPPLGVEVTVSQSVFRPAGAEQLPT